MKTKIDPLTASPDEILAALKLTPSEQKTFREGADRLLGRGVDTESSEPSKAVDIRARS